MRRRVSTGMCLARLPLGRPECVQVARSLRTRCARQVQRQSAVKVKCALHRFGPLNAHALGQLDAEVIEGAADGFERVAQLVEPSLAHVVQQVALKAGPANQQSETRLLALNPILIEEQDQLPIAESFREGSQLVGPLRQRPAAGAGHHRRERIARSAPFGRRHIPNGELHWLTAVSRTSHQTRPNRERRRL